MIDVKSHLHLFLIMIFYCLGFNLINIILSTHLTSVPGDILNHQISRNLGNITSFYYITFDVIKLMSACIITLFYLLYNLISLKVIYVTFDTNQISLSLS